MLVFHRNQSGVTLLELMVIAVMIGVLSAMAIPRWLEYLPQLRTKTAARDTISTLREARSLAISQKVDYGVHFNVYDGNYTLFANTSDPGQATFSEEDSVISRNDIGLEVRMNYTTFPDNCVVFDPNGAASGSGTIMVNSGNYQSMFTIEVLQATGRVKLHEGYYFGDPYMTN
jgi:Tfp pilus assembly protein FimT